MNKVFSALLRLSLVSVLTGVACASLNQPSSINVSATAVPPSSPAATLPAVSTLPPAPTATQVPTVPLAPTAADAAATSAAPVSVAGPFEITGAFTYTNDYVFTYFEESSVALVDMYGFVKRDEIWKIPVKSQTLGYIKVDTQTKSANFWLQLPAHPDGQAVNVSNDGQNDPGVQIFAVTWWPNLAGGPFSEGDDFSQGWPSYLTSTKVDATNHNEVTGGKLVVWAPDAKEKFPAGFGPDGLLFTKDDPVGPLPAGYSVIDLDQSPFAVSQPAQPTLTLYEPNGYAVKDYSKLSYTDSFEKLFQVMSTEWAFNGVKGKEVDWKALHDQIAPRVAEAEKNKDAAAFYQAVHTFIRAIPDGHTGLGGQLGDEAFQSLVSSGYGFAIRELDDGSVIVVYVLKDGPADKAGIQVGAQVTNFNNKPIGDAIGAAQPYGTFSMASAKRYQQARYLLRAPAGTEASVTFVNPEATSKTATLTAVREYQSFNYTSLFRGSDQNALPAEARILDSGIGYIKLNSYYDDLELLVRLFERALITFQNNQVTDLIIDLRQNSGGNPVGLPGFLFDKEIPLGQNMKYNEKTGKFEPDGPRNKVTPMEEQYKFDKIAVLVSPACYSACEIEAYGFSKIPGTIVVGMYSSAGVEADVGSGQFSLPEDLTGQFPTARIVNPDGSLFLEGTGVQPTLRVPVTAENVLSTDDVVLTAAEKALQGK